MNDGLRRESLRRRLGRELRFAGRIGRQNAATIGGIDFGRARQGGIGLDIGQRPHQQAWRVADHFFRRQEQILLGRAAADQRRQDVGLAVEFSRAPGIHGQGRFGHAAFVDALQHTGRTEIFDADIEAERYQGIELVLVQRHQDHVVEAVDDRQQIETQQRIRIFLRHPGAFTRRKGMTVADGPTPVRQARRRLTQPFETLDQFDPGAGDFLTRSHSLSCPFCPRRHMSHCPKSRHAASDPPQLANHRPFNLYKGFVTATGQIWQKTPAG